MFAIAVAISLAACSSLQTQRNRVSVKGLNFGSGPGPEGRLSIMSNGLSFDLKSPPKDWMIATGDENTTAKSIFSPLSSVRRNGVPALEIRSGPTKSIAVRRVSAMLMATPYLSWSWNLSDHGPGIHPVRMVIGFQGGAPQGTSNKGQKNGLPDHDRALALVWGDTALRRGNLSVPPPGRPREAAVYTVRGGRENTRKWWRDTVDLSELYKKAWPNDKRRPVRITFIGMAAAPRMPAVRGRISGVELSH